MWISAHLHFAADSIYGAECDEILVEHVAPLLLQLQHRGALDRFFFVRYSLLGPHIRLRMSGDVAAAQAGVEELANTGHIEVRYVSYEPETERYGGPRALSVAEQVFHTSSEATLSLVKSSMTVRPRRLGQTALTMLLQAQVFCDTPVRCAALLGRYHTSHTQIQSPGNSSLASRSARFADAYSRQEAPVRAMVDDFCDRVNANDAFEEPLQSLALKLRDHRNELETLVRSKGVAVRSNPACDWDTCVEQIIPSYIHMTNNRLGVPPAEEALLAYMLSRAMQERIT